MLGYKTPNTLLSYMMLLECRSVTNFASSTFQYFSSEYISSFYSSFKKTFFGFTIHIFQIRIHKNIFTYYTFGKRRGRETKME